MSKEGARAWNKVCIAILEGAKLVADWVLVGEIKENIVVRHGIKYLNSINVEQGVEIKVGVAWNWHVEERVVKDDLLSIYHSPDILETLAF